MPRIRKRTRKRCRNLFLSLFLISFIYVMLAISFEISYNKELEELQSEFISLNNQPISEDDETQYNPGFFRYPVKRDIQSNSKNTKILITPSSLKSAPKKGNQPISKIDGAHYHTASIHIPTKKSNQSISKINETPHNTASIKIPAKKEEKPISKKDETQQNPAPTTSPIKKDNQPISKDKTQQSPAPTTSPIKKDNQPISKDKTQQKPASTSSPIKKDNQPISKDKTKQNPASTSSPIKKDNQPISKDKTKQNPAPTRSPIKKDNEPISKDKTQQKPASTMNPVKKDNQPISKDKTKQNPAPTRSPIKKDNQPISKDKTQQKPASTRSPIKKDNQPISKDKTQQNPASLRNPIKNDNQPISKKVEAPLNTASRSIKIPAKKDNQQISKNDETHQKPVLLRNSKTQELITAYHMKGLRLRQMFNCSLLIKSDVLETKKAMDFLANRKANDGFLMVPDSDFHELLEDCTSFRSIRGYRQAARTEEESNFPLAYVILIHKDFEQMERMVRSLYQPQNVFCIHVDLKAPESLQKAVEKFASCFPNIYVASQRYNITYAHVSRLLADIVCMKDLAKLKHPWRYLLTMVSSEFPLRTNLQKVKILTSLKGANDIRQSFKDKIPSRYTQKYILQDGLLKMTRDLKLPPPHNITINKGRAANAFSRAFVDWIFRDPKAFDLLEWSMDTLTPDEHYWATLNDLYHNPFLGTPGGFYGHPDTKRYFSNFVVWTPKSMMSKPPHCNGILRHHICIFGTRDLFRLERKHQLTANKLDINYDPVVYACMEGLLEGRESNPQPLDWSMYGTSKTKQTEE